MTLSRTGFATTQAIRPARVQVDPRIAARIQTIHGHSPRVAVLFQGQTTTYDDPEQLRLHMAQVHAGATREKARRAWDDRGLRGLPYRLAADVGRWVAVLAGFALALAVILIERGLP